MGNCSYFDRHKNSFRKKSAVKDNKEIYIIRKLKNEDQEVSK